MRVTSSPALYLAAIIVAEIVTAAANPLWGGLAHVAILGALLGQAARTPAPRLERFLLSLAIAPIVRIVSLSLPLGSFPQQWWYGLASVPLLATAVVVIRVVPLRRREVGIQLPHWRHWPATLLVAASGSALGAIQALILRPEPLVGSLAPEVMALPAATLLIGTGVTEELLFRGILQATARDLLGVWPGIVYVSVLFGVLNIGHLSPLNVIFVIGVALYFAAIVRWTGTLIGVSLAHGLTNLMLFIIVPLQ